MVRETNFWRKHNDKRQKNIATLCKVIHFSKWYFYVDKARFFENNLYLGRRDPYHERIKPSESSQSILVSNVINSIIITQSSQQLHTEMKNGVISFCNGCIYQGTAMSLCIVVLMLKMKIYNVLCLYSQFF